MLYIEIVDADYNNTGAYHTSYTNDKGEILENFEPSENDVCIDTKYLHFD